MDVVFRRFSMLAALCAVSAGVLVVIGGWAADLAALRSVFPGLATMKPNTALGLACCGLALWGGGGSVRPWARRAGFMAGLVAAAIGGATLIEYVFAVNLGIDEWLFRDPWSAVWPGRPAPNTALAIFLTASALLCLDREAGAGRRPSEWLTLVAGSIGIVGLLGYAYGAQSLYRVAVYSSMAVHSAFLIVLLNVGVLCARPRVGLMAALTSDTAGGHMARRLLPMALAAPPLLGGAAVFGRWVGWYDATFGMVVFAASIIGVFIALVWWNAHALARLDRHRRVMLEELQRAKEGLEVRVEERTSALQREVLERRYAEEKIRELNADLARRNADLLAVNKELEAFSYSVSHDLQAPLRAIDGFSEALLVGCRDRLDDQHRDHLTRVRSAAQRMGQLIDDLLKLGRVTRGGLAIKDIDLTSLAHEIVQDLMRGAPSRDVQWSIAPGLRARGDARLLRIALENLLHNALKFTCGVSPAEITVGATPQNGSAVFFVRDNGAGFDMAYVDKLFGVFQRLHSGPEFPGTGIGLATVQRVMVKHGGRAWAEGAVAKGATFYFTVEPDSANIPSH